MDPYSHPSSMTLSPQSQSQSPSATPSSNASSVFRPRRSEDWNEYREFIEQLYRSDQLKLRDVKRIMEREYKFCASEKQYKDRLAAWNVRKNIKAAEVQVMIRKKQKRADRGKQTAFRRACQNVDPKRTTRFVRRYGSSWVKNRDKDAELQSPEPSTPSDMSCYTPEPEEVSTPISPPDLQSSTRETPHPMRYDRTYIDSIPHLVMDDEHAFPMSLHNHSSRRAYHPSDLVAHSVGHPAAHVTHPGLHMVTYSNVHPNVHGPVLSPMYRVIHPPIIHTSINQPLHPSIHHHHQVHPSVHSPGHPVVTQIPAPAPISSHHHDDSDAPGKMVTTHPDDWNHLDAFQKRLNRLHSKLEESMAKWSSRDQDPDKEVRHHEGLGL